MNWVDYAMITIAAVSVIIGLYRGLVREVVSLVIWIGGILVTLHNIPAIENYLMGSISSAYARYAVILVGVILALSIVSWLFGKILHTMITSVGLGFTNRFFGLIFGFTRGVVVIGFLLVLLSAGGIKESPAFQASVLIPSMQPLVRSFAALIPEDLGEQLSQHIPELSKSPELTGDEQADVVKKEE
jgi:membrane protein required for colicin V production